MEDHRVSHESLVKLVGKLPARSAKTLVTIRVITGCSLKEAYAFAGEHGRSPEYIKACQEEASLDGPWSWHTRPDGTGYEWSRCLPGGEND